MGLREGTLRRPATGRDLVTVIGLSSEPSAQVEEWREQQVHRSSRSEAMDQLVVEALQQHRRSEPPRGSLQVTDAGVGDGEPP